MAWKKLETSSSAGAAAFVVALLAVASMNRPGVHCLDWYQEGRAECQMWAKLEDRTLSLQNQGHAKCRVDRECTGFTCDGTYLDKDIMFGMRVMPCQHPPGVEIFGSAPQFNAKNFSHVFTHKAEYEVPGALLNVSMLPAGGIVDSSSTNTEMLQGLKGRLEVRLTMNHENQTMTLGLTAKACVNSTCITSRPVFNDTVIPVPECKDGVHTVDPPQVKVYSVCQMSDIESCGPHQMCQQTGKDSHVGICICLNGYGIRDEDHSCVPNDEGPPRPKKAATSRQSSLKGGVTISADLEGQEASPEGSGGSTTSNNGGTIVAVAVSLLTVLAVIGSGFFVLTRTRFGTRLRARLTNTPYADIVVNDNNGQMLGSATALDMNNSPRHASA